MTFNPVINADGDYEIHNAEGKCIAKRPREGIYYDNTNYFLNGVDSIEELKEKMILPVVTDEELDFLEVQAKELYYNTDKALLYMWAARYLRKDSRNSVLRISITTWRLKKR